MLVGIGLFLLGSLLCGLAWSMTSLIAFRAVQGLGAGAVQPMGMTIVGDIYSVAGAGQGPGLPRQRVGASSAVVGPTLGGVFSDYLSWRWIFFVNLPIGLAAGWVLWRRFEERVERRPHRIDYAGAVLLAARRRAAPARACSRAACAGTWALGRPASRSSPPPRSLLAAFVLVERRAAEPVLPLWVFRHRVVVAAMLTSLVVGVLMMGLSSYVPLYAQSVLGHGAVASGLRARRADAGLAARGVATPGGST